MKRIFSVLTLALLLASVAYPQDSALPTDARYFTIGLGIPLNTVRDQAHSMLTYNGSGFRLFIRTEHYKADQLFRFQFTTDRVTLQSRVRPKQDIKKEALLSDMQFSWGFYKRLGDTPLADNQQYVGLTYTLHANTREYGLPSNNINGFLLQNGIGIGGIDRRVVEANEWTATTHIDIPLVNAIYRPSYIGLPALLHLQKPGFKDVLRGMEFGSFNLFTKIAVGVDFDQQKQPWRANRYAYDWHLLYTPRPATKPLVSTTGCLMYGLNVLL